MNNNAVLFQGTEDEIYNQAVEFVSSRKPKLNKMQEMLIGYARFDALPLSDQKRLVGDHFATGNTTREALGYILMAGNSPNTPVKIPNHCGARYVGGLHDVIKSLIEKLEFKFYKFDKVHGTLTFEI